MRIGLRVQEGWTQLATRNSLTIEVGGIPPLSHFSFVGSEPLSMKSLFVQLMLERGFLASTSFYAMGAHTEAHVDAYLGAADGVLAEIAEAVGESSVRRRLKGEPASGGFTRLA